MTYASDIAVRNHKVGFFVVFDGVGPRLATHDFTALFGGADTYYPAMVGPPDGSGLSLDRERSVILPGGFTVRVMDTDNVRSLLRRRGGTEDFLTSSLSSSATTISTKFGSFSTGDTVYLERETITLGTKSGTDYTGSTRGAHSSQARPHGSGLVVSSVPRHWMGRRAQLYAINLDTGTSQVIRTGILSRSPAFSDGIWTLEFIDLQKELNRPLFRGWQTDKVLSKAYGSSSMTLNVGDARNFAGGTHGYVQLRFGGHLEVYSLTEANVDRVNNQITLNYDDMLYTSSSRPFPQLTEQLDVEVQQVGYLVQDPALAALTFMLSEYGDGNNHATYDVLPGVSPALTSSTGDLVGRRVGAGIPSAWVDTSAWEAMEGLDSSTVFYIDEQTRLLDFLVNEVAWRIGGYVYVNDSGQISFRRYLPAIPQASLPTLGKDEITLANVNSIDDEAGILSSATFDCNWDPVTRQFLLRKQVGWVDTVGTYGEGLPSLEFAPRSVWIGAAQDSVLTSPATPEWQVLSSLDRLYARTRDGVRRLKMALPWSKHIDYVPGYVFALTDDRLPDHEGSTGVTARQMEVTATNPDYDQGRVEIEAEEMPQGFMVAPAGIVASVAGKTITFDTSGVEADLFDSNPGADFPTSCQVRIYDASASPPFSVSEVETTSGGSGNTLDLDALPSLFTIAAGDLVCLEFSANTGNTNADGADVQDHLFMVGSDNKIGTGADEREGTTWA